MIIRAFEAFQSTFIRPLAYTDRPRSRRRHETEQMGVESTNDSTQQVKE